MRRSIVAALLIAATAAPAAAADRSFAASGFDKIDLAAAATVDVHSGGDFAVRADGDPRLLDRLDIGVRDGTLVIGWRRGSQVHLDRNSKLHIAVTLPRIAAATISGAGSLTIDRAEVPTRLARRCSAAAMARMSL